MVILLSYLAVLFLRLSSWLPLWYLQIWSSIGYYVLYYVIGYRRSVVRNNLTKSFPDKTLKEIIKIEKEYYRHLCDLIVENIWALRASKSQIQKRCTIVNHELLGELYKKNQNFICLLGHTGNWEWCSLSFSTYRYHHLWALYRPIKNKVFNRFFLKLRGRFGARLVPMHQVIRAMNAPGATPYVVAFIADQSPVPEYAYWTTFMNQPTCFFNGYEKIAMKRKLPVLYIHFNKISRSRYEITVEELTPDASMLAPNEITRQFVTRLENYIHQQPSYWLWSHKRWKHKPPVTE